MLIFYVGRKNNLYCFKIEGFKFFYNNAHHVAVKFTLQSSIQLVQMKQQDMNKKMLVMQVCEKSKNRRNRYVKN